MQRGERQDRALFAVLVFGVLGLLVALGILTWLLNSLSVPDLPVRDDLNRPKPRRPAVAEATIEITAPEPERWQPPVEPVPAGPALTAFSPPKGPAFGPSVAERPGFLERLKYDPTPRSDGVHLVFRAAGEDDKANNPN